VSGPPGGVADRVDLTRPVAGNATSSACLRPRRCATLLRKMSLDRYWAAVQDRDGPVEADSAAPAGETRLFPTTGYVPSSFGIATVLRATFFYMV
jgi:hypothetical protein